MTRKKFLQDLSETISNPPAHVTNIERYDGDGISFTYWYIRGNIRQELGLKMITTNVDDYPDGNQFMLFTEDVDVETIITNIFAQLEAVISGSSLLTALHEISNGLHQALTLGLAENPIQLDSGSQLDQESEVDDFDLEEQDDFDDDANFGLDQFLPIRDATKPTIRSEENVGVQDAEAIKHDLRAAKEAGFKVGVHGDLSKAGVVCISIRVAKLGISDEALQAWGLSRNQYAILLIRFQRGYKFLMQVMEEPTLSGSVEMRVGLSDTYKPRSEEAFEAFNQIDAGFVSQNAPQVINQDDTLSAGSFKSLFIGRPIHDLLRDRFPKIVKFRHRFNLSWCGAERLFNDRQGTLHSDLFKDMSAYTQPMDTTSRRALPDLVVKDTLSERPAQQASLPLVAMQFFLRHFVRCTEFCLVCHCRVEDTFEALKPYVCSNPLCLYQFLALGFGPAAEWEILSQPYVVDLLVSLCYSQARASRIREFPLGINLKVPVLPHFSLAVGSTVHHHRGYVPPVPQSDRKPPPKPIKAFKAKFFTETNILSPIANSWASGKQCVTRGDWVVLVDPTGTSSIAVHCRIIDERGLDLVLGTTIHCQTVVDPALKGNFKLTDQPVKEVDCYLYDTNFDDLPDSHRHHAIKMLLDTLPSVKGMRKELVEQQGGHRDANLSLMRRLCPQAALDLLRWIIASNRSCIMQVDAVTGDKEMTQNLKPSGDRVSGMDEWMQFRFAQGAPDKEQRFIDCVQAKSASLEFPTLFAWHGSPLYNWHSIIRQGLNFDEILHGRASGHGVYMSPFVSTSMGYVSGVACDWPKSILQVSSVISLQEIVNAPDSFVSKSPHFVVAEKDWIQTRYLFVKTSARHSIGSTSKDVYQQDPLYAARGSKNEFVTIPITAISKSRRPEESNSKTPKAKKRKIAAGENDFDDSDDGASVTTDDEDWELLAENWDDLDHGDVIMTDVDDVGDHTPERARASSPSSPSNSKKRSHENGESFILDRSKTDFVPGSLDTTGIRFLAPPSYASVSASKALMRAFNDTIKVQEKTPLHDLGFYIDPNRIENMYQWIVELHSFEKTLPLAQDMKAAGVTSVVFEMLFTNDFPFSPPFIRVVKPRFLDPMMGGGGHITSGGAICMELLTSTGWSAVNSIESVLLQVRLAMCERERPARLLSGRGGFHNDPYPVSEAIQAYKRFCQKYGWQPPKGLDDLQTI